jgi:hypothetical protein
MQELEAERRQWLFRVEATRSRVQAVRHMRSQSRRDEHSPPPLPPAALALDTPKTAPTIEERGAASKYSSRSSRLPPLAPRLTKPAVVKIHHGQLSHVVPMTPSRGWRYFAMAD